MILNGKYNECIVYTDLIDSSTEGQLKALLNQESIKDSKIRIMPDCHAAKGSVVGTTMTIKDKVIPNVVGVDIGCGMLVVKLKEKRIDLPKFDSIVKQYISSGGFKKQSESIYHYGEAKQLRCYNKIKTDLVDVSIGTLGGGNHFIELDKDEDGNIYLVIHTGSRNLGVQVCEYYQKQAYEKLKDINIPYELAYVEGQLFEDYIHDMKIVQDYASNNRFTIASMIMKKAKLHSDNYEYIETLHNYIDIDNFILRKGAISAQAGERLIIPMNMRDGSLLCIGKGNPDWNYSAPHGAGRLLSRADAKSSISMKDYKEAMNAIYSSTVCKDTIDESPMAYKPMEEIISNIGDTVEIEKIIKPIYNFKAKE